MRVLRFRSFQIEKDNAQQKTQEARIKKSNKQRKFGKSPRNNPINSQFLSILSFLNLHFFIEFLFKYRNFLVNSHMQQKLNVWVLMRS
jgi:flagellar biosynthesis protein FlhB